MSVLLTVLLPLPTMARNTSAGVQVEEKDLCGL